MAYFKELLIQQMEEDETRVALRSALANASGPALALAVSSDLITFAELRETGLPRGDRHAELAMLYREDCEVQFLRDSRFRYEALRDPGLPRATARALLRSNPSALELRLLSRRKDIATKTLQLAALTGRARARARGENGADYSALTCLGSRWLESASTGVDAEIVGLLRNPNCPEEVVQRYVTCGSARVRHQALAVTHRRGLPIESALIRAARDLPMTDSANYPLRERVRGLADRILAAR